MWLRAAVVGKERQKKKKKQRESFSVSKCVMLLSIFGLFWFLPTGCRVRWHRIKKSCCPYQPTKVRETFAFLHVLFRRDLALNITSKSLKWRQQLSVGDFTCSSFILERLAVSVCAPYKVVDARISFFFFLPKINGGGSVPVSSGKRMFPWKLPKTLAAEAREMRVLFLSLSLSISSEAALDFQATWWKCKLTVWWGTSNNHWHVLWQPGKLALFFFWKHSEASSTYGHILTVFWSIWWHRSAIQFASTVHLTKWPISVCIYKYTHCFKGS